MDSVVNEREVLTAVVSRYGRPPFDVSHGGGVFTTELVERGSADDIALQAFNREVLRALGLVRGVSHTEFIKGADGLYYFLETSARVGGAHIVELVEAATGMNLWAEWAKVELAGGKGPYAVPPTRQRLRRARHVARQAGVARSVGVRRSRSGVAADQAASRRPDRGLTRPRARGGTGAALRAAPGRRLQHVAAAGQQSAGLGTLGQVICVSWRSGDPASVCLSP